MVRRRWWAVYRDVLSQEFPVADSDSARPIHTYDVLIILADFHYNPCVVPFGGVVAKFGFGPVRSGQP